MSFLSIQGLHIAYKDNQVLQNFSLEVLEGSIYAIMGPSGCGKSTLLKSICGIIPSKGNIMLKGEPVNPVKHTLGYIPQHYGLLDWLTVSENLSVGEKICKTSASQKDRIIDQLEMTNWLHHYPQQLSGGQQQRTALARAWILQPDLLLMDEPFSSLDTFTAEKSRELFLQLWKKRKTTTIFVTHNLQEAVRMGKYIILLSKQPAKVLEVIENPLFKPGAKPDAPDFYSFEQNVKKIIQEKWEVAND